MKFIEKIKIGFKKYNLNKVNKEVIWDNSVCYGKIDYENCIIEISELYTKEQQECTLIHECIHGIDEFLQIELTEEQVVKLGKGLYLFIQDNKELFKDIEGDKLE